GRRAAGRVPLVMLAALVASVEQEAAESLKLPQVGRAFEIAPAAEIAVRKLLAAPVSATTVVPMTPEAFLSWKRRSVESEKTESFPDAGDAGAATLVSVSATVTSKALVTCAAV